jgi:hypothetical protein
MAHATVALVGLLGVAASAALAAPTPADADPLNTIQDVVAALRACWLPPPIEQAKPGMEISVRFSFNVAGEIIDKPRFTYATAGVSPAMKESYQRAVTATLKRCTPLPFTAALGSALAGRPFSIRFIDDRTIQRPERRA